MTLLFSILIKLTSPIKLNYYAYETEVNN